MQMILKEALVRDLGSIKKLTFIKVGAVFYQLDFKIALITQFWLKPIICFICSPWPEHEGYQNRVVSMSTWYF